MSYQSKYTGSEIDAGIDAAKAALPKNGGAMLGALILAGDPADENAAVTKKYVDNAVKNIELTPGENGKDGVSVTHSWNGTVLSVTSASGTSSADLKGEKGDSGSDANVNAENIRSALGYTPADAEDVNRLSVEIGDLYENDIIYKETSFVFTASKDAAYQSKLIVLEGWKPGETYICSIGAVENAIDNNVASLEVYNSAGTRIKQVFIPKSTLNASVVLDDDASEFRIVYRPNLTSSIPVGTVVTWKNVEIFSGTKRIKGYNEYVDIAATPDRWTPGTTIVSNSGALSPSATRVSFLDYIAFKQGFECRLAYPVTLTVAKYDVDFNYLGYDSISAKRVYSADECKGVLFRFTYLIQGGTATLETLGDDVKILYKADAQTVADDIYRLGKKVDKVAEEEIPDYFQDEIEATAADTLAVTDAPCITFALVTDTHQNATDKTVRNIREVDKAVNFDSILHLGDVMNTMGDQQYFYDTCYAEIEAYRKSVQTGKLYATPGNHDGYALNGKNDTSVDSELYRTLFRVADERTQTVREGDKPYYYVDFAKNKVRFIFLSSKSYTMTNGAYTYVYGFNDEQVEWLLDVLENTEDGWHVTVCSHIPPIDTVLNTPTFNVGITGNNGQNVVNILQAWKNRTTVAFKGNTYDFSDLKANKFIAWLCGHVHGDMIKVYQDLTFVTVTAVAAFIPSDWVMPEGGSFVAERTKNTLTWDSWNSCVLRPDESKLYLFRFGAGEDMVVSY